MLSTDSFKYSFIMRIWQESYIVDIYCIIFI